MKYSCILLLFFSLHTSAQKLEILLIGASHNYAKSPEQDLSGIRSEIRRFKPDAFFGEFLSKEDEQHLMAYWCKKDNVKRWNNLKKNRNIPTEKIPGVIDSLKKLIEIKSKDFRLKTDLAHAYYLNNDVSNGHYQYWQVSDQLQKKPDPELEAYVNNLLSPELDVTGRSMKRLRTSEYALIAFPMMKEMKIQELLPMDCRDYDLNWPASVLAFYENFEVFKKDTSASYTSEVRSLLARRDEGFKRYGSIEKTSKNFTEWLNTDEASSVLASGDFYYQEMYDITNFPKESMLSQLHWWLMRNKGMCENVVNRAKSVGAKRVVVIVGANHRKYMQDIFKQFPNVTIHRNSWKPLQK